MLHDTSKDRSANLDMDVAKSTKHKLPESKIFPFSIIFWYYALFVSIISRLFNKLQKIFTSPFIHINRTKLLPDSIYFSLFHTLSQSCICRLIYRRYLEGYTLASIISRNKIIDGRIHYIWKIYVHSHGFRRD